VIGKNKTMDHFAEIERLQKKLQIISDNKWETIEMLQKENKELKLKIKELEKQLNKQKINK
jgi:hypothetical protein